MFLLFWREFSHGQGDLKDHANVQYEILLIKERVVDRFLVTVFLLYNISDCWFR